MSSDAVRSGTSVLVVCTGNVCRSPAAQLLLAAGLLDAGVTVTSAGTRALSGRPVDPPMARLLRDSGIVTDGFAARDLRPEILREADVVLAAAREHRAAAVAMAPAALRRTLLLTDAAAVAEAVAAAGWPADVAPDPGARLAALPRLAAAHRAPGRPAGADVPDPYRRDLATYAASLQVVRDAVDRLVHAVV
ncbi:hypothetical protein ACI79J_11005 [Geodermatophilus sp. SYSU D01062]